MATYILGQKIFWKCICLFNELSVIHIIWCQMTGWWVNNELGRCGGKSNLKSYTSICLEGSRKTTKNFLSGCRIWGSHSDCYKEFHLLGYNAMQSVECQLTFQRTCFHAGFLLSLFFDSEDGGDMFLQNISWH
jgi:hypothetical protein